MSNQLSRLYFGLNKKQTTTIEKVESGWRVPAPWLFRYYRAQPPRSFRPNNRTGTVANYARH